MRYQLENSKGKIWTETYANDDAAIEAAQESADGTGESTQVYRVDSERVCVQGLSASPLARTD